MTKPVVFLLLLVAGPGLFYLTTSPQQHPTHSLAERTAAGGFNYTRIKQAVVSLRALQQLDPDFWGPYLQALYNIAKPDAKYHSCKTPPATSRLMFMKLIVFNDEDLGAVMYFAGVHKDASTIPDEIRDLFVAMRRNACGLS